MGGRSSSRSGPSVGSLDRRYKQRVTAMRFWRRAVAFQGDGLWTDGQHHGSGMDFERYGCAVILTDDAIANVLAPVVAGELVVPYPGAWARPPYESRAGRPVIAHDPGLSAIVVDRDRGTVALVDTNGEGVLNASLAVFVECARRYTAAIHTPDADDDSWEIIGRRL